MSDQCKICSSILRPFSRARVLQKYDVSYYQCPSCGFVQTEKPYWLGESYSKAITSTDLGLLGRNWLLMQAASSVITFMVRSRGPFLDYGGGLGIFVRLMRDRGFNFYWHDKYSLNQFAAGFGLDSHSGQGDFDLVTAFELAEHLEDPVAEFNRMKSLSPNILFSTVLLPAHNPAPDQWWYYNPDHGQHVSFFTPRSLHELAARLGMHLVSDGWSLHLLSGMPRSNIAFKLLVSRWGRGLAQLLVHNRSLLEDDYRKSTGYDKKMMSGE